MNSDTTYNIHTTAAAATSALGERLAPLLPDRMVLELISDLGGGKTTFVQGLARGLGYSGEVTSPTFALSRIYPLPGGRELHHFDLYRLAGADVVLEELADSAGQPNIITAVEWPQTATWVLPKDRLTITFDVVSEDERNITMIGHGEHSAKVLEGLRS